MANVEFNPVVEGTKGALSKGGLITRQWTKQGGAYPLRRTRAPKCHGEMT